MIAWEISCFEASSEVKIRVEILRKEREPVIVIMSHDQNPFVSGQELKNHVWRDQRFYCPRHKKPTTKSLPGSPYFPNKGEKKIEEKKEKKFNLDWNFHLAVKEASLKIKGKGF